MTQSRLVSLHPSFTPTLTRTKFHSNGILTLVILLEISLDKYWFVGCRNKSGLWGWRSDKTELINGRDCKVFSASNVELVTKTRTEHLTPEDKSKIAGSRFLLNSLLAVGQVEETSNAAVCLTPFIYSD